MADDWEDIGGGWRIRNAKELYSEIEEVVACGGWVNKESRDVFEKMGDKLVEKGFTADEAVDILWCLFDASCEEEKSTEIWHNYQMKKLEGGGNSGEDSGRVEEERV